MNQENEEKINYDTLVLSGGAVKGFIILGAIQALFDLKLLNNIKNYYGTSIGAIICYMLAIGYTPIELMVEMHINRCLERMQFFNIVAMTNGNGATSFTALQETLEKLTINKIGEYITLGKLKEKYGKTLIVSTYNMTTCKMEYISPDKHPDIPCLTALRMSSNLPLIFDRFKYMDCFWVDGGIFDNFPILKAQELGNKIIGINLKIDDKSLQDNPDDSIITYFFRLLQVPISQSTQYRIEQAGNKCTIISVNSNALQTTLEFNIDNKSRLEMFSSGYTQVKKYFEPIQVEL